jgi:hypothetical protein
MVRFVTSSKASKSRRNSLTVNVISPVGVGAVSRSVAVATVRKAWASMATRPVSRPSRQPATGPPDSYPDRTHTGRRRRAFDQVMT